MELARQNRGVKEDSTEQVSTDLEEKVGNENLASPQHKSACWVHPPRHYRFPSWLSRGPLLFLIAMHYSSIALVITLFIRCNTTIFLPLFLSVLQSPLHKPFHLYSVPLFNSLFASVLQKCLHILSAYLLMSHNTKCLCLLTSNNTHIQIRIPIIKGYDVSDCVFYWLHGL